MCECLEHDAALVFARSATAGALLVYVVGREGLGNMRNVLIVIAVALVVAGVAWFRSTRQEAGSSNATLASPSAGTAQTKPTGGQDVAATPKQLVSASPRAAPETAKAKKLPRVIDLGSDKCIPCKKMAPILEELRKEYEGRVVIEFIDVWKNPKAGEPYRIRVIPTQIFFDADGREVWRHEGYLSKEEFLKKFAEMGIK